MKKKLLAGLAVGVMMLGMTSMADAGLIVDTGTNFGGPSWSLNSNQWLAGQFSVSQAYTITDVEGYMWGNDGNLLTAAIYTDGGVVPGAELFSQQFAVGAGGSDNAGWYGASGLSWVLAPGTYWASFEVRAGDTYQGSLPGSALNPLVKEAYTSGSTWNNQDSLDLAIRISADTGTAPVPEPATMLLMGTGLVGLIGARRKKKA